MKRELKFRAKDKDTNEWLAGNLVQDDYGNCCLVGFIDHHETWYDVVPETVGQFTGLYDKNGKEIYEGDIVTFTKEIINGVIFQEKGFVKYRPDYAMFVLQTDTEDEILSYCTRHIEVIGNIYDNANLLEE